MNTVRRPAVAGMFYPGEAARLRETVESLLAKASPRDLRPKALIVPHAGYIYSGPVAASAYRLLEPIAAGIRRVVLLGPSHYVPFKGLALPSATRLATPLGEVAVDAVSAESVKRFAAVKVRDDAHAREHSLEVQLPFLQVALGEFTIVPLAVGSALAEDTAEVLDALWGGAETLIVVSSDLSHYHPYATAAVVDRETTEAIERLDGRFIDGERACGCHPIRGLLHCVRRRGLRVTTLDQRNSGDTAGDKSRVVGYGAWAFV